MCSIALVHDDATQLHRRPIFAAPYSIGEGARLRVPSQAERGLPSRNGAEHSNLRGPSVKSFIEGVKSQRRNSTDRTGRSKKVARHVRLYYWMIETAAWKSLNGNQRAIYFEMAARYNGSNNGRIPYSVREAAERLRIGKSTAARDLAVLQDRGFIIPRKKGAFSLKVRHATEWRLTEFCCDVTLALPTKEFTRWVPKIQNTVPPQNSTVPVVGPNGMCSGTASRKNGPNSTYSGSVDPVSANSRYPQWDTSKLPVGLRR